MATTFSLCLSSLLLGGCSSAVMKNGSDAVLVEHASRAEKGLSVRQPLAMPSSLADSKSLPASLRQGQPIGSMAPTERSFRSASLNAADAVRPSADGLAEPSAWRRSDREIVLAASDEVAVPADADADAGPPAAAGDDLAKLAQKTNNPIGDAWLLITQNDTTLIGGDEVDGTEVLNVVKFRPVLSVPVADDAWNFVIRPVVQIASVPLDKDAGNLIGVAPNDIIGDSSLADIAADPYGRTNGLGDSVLLTLLGPNADNGWILAGGLTQILPTAQLDVLGQGKWQAGPAALAVRLGSEYGGFGLEDFNVGALAQQWWSYAGDDDRDSTNQMDIQYFVNWKANATQLIGMTPNISINWDADGGFDDKVALPIGIGTIGLFKVGKLPVRWGIEAQYYLTGNDDIKREANFRFFIAPIIANPFK